jgi:hypothetical protein
MLQRGRKSKAQLAVVGFDPDTTRSYPVDDAAERSILCPRADMKGAFKFLNGVAIDTYLAKVKSGPNCFDHMIASDSIMPSTIRVAESVIPKLSDHAALVAEWARRRS